MGRFWMDDDFIRVKARHLSLKAIVVFMALSSHANGKGSTFIGHRKLGEELGLNKDSVTRAMRELEASDLVRRLRGKNGLPSETVVPTVRNDTLRPSDSVRHKEVIKEDIKEQNLIGKMMRGSTKGRVSLAKEALRAKWSV